MDNNDQTEIETNENEQEAIESSTVDQAGLEGKIRISEDVISQLAIKALLSVDGIQPANPGLMVNLRMGRKAANGVRISISDGDTPEIQVDTYVTVKYSLRIPDVCWDVQEAVKDQIEKYTGYTVKSVNVYVQGITFPDNKPAETESTAVTAATEA
ncbi:MAG: Asp23/Gls24 family envelope stress response protein [Synergistaceae bacterium]|nr:Asp23/Gls24 family envelope stress response protein [Synergistaceae bacterium]